jgi:hypothetical protein
MKREWKIGDRVAILTRTNKYRTVPECVRIQTITKLTATQIVLDSGARYYRTGAPVGHASGSGIRLATSKDEQHMAKLAESRNERQEQLAQDNRERQRLSGLFPPQLQPSVSIQSEGIELTFTGLGTEHVERIAEAIRNAK